MADVFCQTFTAGISGLGEIITVPLAEGGDEIMVTEDNRRDYVELYLNFVMNVSIHKQVSTPHAWACACKSSPCSARAGGRQCVSGPVPVNRHPAQLGQEAGNVSIAGLLRRCMRGQPDAVAWHAAPACSVAAPC